MRWKLKMEDKYLYCEKMFVKAGINRHLIKHLEERGTKGRFGRLLGVRIEQYLKWGRTLYFLSFWMDDEIPINGRTKNVFSEELNLQYGHDLGSSTEFVLEVVAGCSVKFGDNRKVE